MDGNIAKSLPVTARNIPANEVASFGRSAFDIDLSTDQGQPSVCQPSNSSLMDDEKVPGNNLLPSSHEREIENTQPEHASEETLQAEQRSNHPNLNKLSDEQYDSFKKWPSILKREMSLFRGKPLKASPDHRIGKEPETLPAERYFSALEGPELEILRPSEDLVLPDDKKWPFLLRFPISSFGICLGVSIQAILWKILATAKSTKFLDISIEVDIALWYISLALMAIISSIYLLKVILYCQAVSREYYHPIRVNFFFAPWIELQLIAIGIPPSLEKYLHQALWYVLMAPILCLELKIYGQWMLGGRRRLSKVANPATHIAVVGNFVGAYFGAMIGLTEGPLFFFAVGLAHFIVLFVTLYQRLPTNETLPKELHPVFFLSVAVPNIGAAAWAKIQGSFDYGARIAYFISLFLFFSLVIRVNLLRGFKFSLVWWAYTVPLTSAAIATISYSEQVTNVFTRALAIIFSAVSTLTVMYVLVKTLLHAFVVRDLFPNDIAIAISDKKPKDSRNSNQLHNESSETGNGNCMKNASLDSYDIEASLNPSHLDASK